MVNVVRKIWVALLVGAMLTAGSAGLARAVDAPKWVAALYIEAQKAIGLRWMPVGGATGYKVLRSETAGSGYAEIASTAQPQHFDKAVQPGVEYFYVLQAVVGAEVSPNSDEKAIKIPGAVVKKVTPPEFTVSKPSTTTEFGRTSYRVGLIWTKVHGGIAYNLYRSETSGSGYALATSTSENQVVDTQIVPNKTYYYVVTALDETFQETPYSKEVLVEVKMVKKKKKKKRKIRLKIAPRASTLLWAKQKGAEAGKFDYFEPYDMALDEKTDTLFVGSNNTWEIYALNATTGDMLAVWGSRGDDPGQFQDLLGLGLGPDGNLYAADRAKGSIQIFTQDGSLVREIVVPVEQNTTREMEGRSEFQDVAVDTNGDMYVSDRSNHAIWVLDESGNVKNVWGEEGHEFNKLKGPLYVNFSPDGKHLVVSNGLSSKLNYWTREGEFVRGWGTRAAAVGAFNFMGGASFDAEGNVAVVDRANSFLMGFLPDGRYLYSAADATGEKGASLYLPKTVIVDSKNRYFVVEGLMDRVQAFQFTGDVPPPQEPDPALEEKEEE
jgi:sugar lactone lactonase YvrE